MSFKDIFKKSFLEGYSGSEIDLVTILAALGIACALAVYTADGKILNTLNFDNN